jgi:hypothetical protein
MDVSTPPRLDLACPQAKTELGKHDHRFMEWSVDKQNTDKNITFTRWKSMEPPCVVLVINDNLYGLMFALSYICRTCP